MLSLSMYLMQSVWKSNQSVVMIISWYFVLKQPKEIHILDFAFFALGKEVLFCDWIAFELYYHGSH